MKLYSPKKMFDHENLDSMSFVVCPVCGFECVHIKNVKKFINDDSYRFEKEISILEHNEVSTRDISEKTHYRGDKVSLSFWGECGHEFSINFYFHKGAIISRVCDETPAKEPEKKQSSKEIYLEYLKSDKWKKKTAKKRKQAGNKCQLCNRGDITLHVHHRTYDNIYNEKLADLIVLCKDCHAKFHDKDKTK